MPCQFNCINWYYAALGCIGLKIYKPDPAKVKRESAEIYPKVHLAKKLLK